jgi:hypothetical protein
MERNRGVTYKTTSMNDTPSNWFIIITTGAFFVLFETLYIFLLNALDRLLSNTLDRLLSATHQGQSAPEPTDPS